MLNKTAAANALAIATVIFYAVFYLLYLAAPGVFQFLFNAQFFGADLAQFIPSEITFTLFLETALTLAIIGWLFGYGLTFFYNRFAR